ncbi:MAG: diguanylate cyclase (GGDEF)-like protein/PAS domain S-box-containing protein [Sulfurimonas sp.]|jgi:diguanylate cyclase (GGDEF)-like protein/PAS domain S-box-containing protein|uniref:EAL domain-containing protein n=1 Tax=Sulfurimonas sp. TaxID=2022749 RepID=UPI0039E53AFC
MLDSVEFLFDFIDDLPVGIARTDTTGKLPNHFNKYFMSMFGWNLEDINTIDKWLSHAYPEDKYRSEVLDVLAKMLDETESHNESYSHAQDIKVTCKDGSFKWCEIIYYRKNNSIYEIFTDITNRKKNEKNLKDIFDNAQSGLMYITGDRVLVKCNQRLADILGYENPEEMIGLSMRKLHLSEEDYIKYGKINLHALCMGEKHNIDYELCRKDGSSIWCEISGKAIDENIPGDISLGVLWTMTDISLRKKYEISLKKSEERYKSFFHANKAIELIVDPKTQEIVDCNKSAENFYGYDRKTLLNMKVSDINIMSQSEIQIEMKYAKEQRREVFHFKHKLYDGIIKDVEVYSGPIELEGKDYLYSIIFDISDRVELENEQAILQERLSSTMERDQHYQEILFNISISLINLPLDEIDSAINNALELMAEYSLSDRAYIFTYDFDAQIASNTHEWCKEDVDKQINDLQDVPLSYFTDWTKSHTDGNIIHIEDVMALPEKGMREILEPQGILSILSLPMMLDEKCIGFIGFDRCKEQKAFIQDDIELLGFFSTIIVNILQRQTTEDKLQLASNVFTHAREGIMIVNPQGNIIDVNRAFSRISGYSKEEVIGQNPRILKSGLQDHDFYISLWKTLKTEGHWEGELWNRHHDGYIYALLSTMSTVYDKHNNILHYVALFSDITTIKDHESKLKKIAHYDLLTGLPNRVLLADRLQQAMIHAQRRETIIGIAYLDLDGFKNINDTYGHDVGDKLLIAVSSNMQKCLRDGDTISRIGGDEFVVVLQDLEDMHSSVGMMKRLLQAAAQPIEIGELNLEVSTSLGMTFYPQAENIDADQLLRQSDQAMYQAKQQGKNKYYVYDTQFERNLRDQHKNIERITEAFEKNEFVLYYQPKVNMKTGVLIGVEALIRWKHPKAGLLSPAHFIPYIEDSVISIDIGEWVIATALKQIKQWCEEGFDIPISVNVGAHQLQQKDFVQRLKGLLDKQSNVEASYLEIELLETVAIGDLQHISNIIHECKSMGVKFSLDDFGTGYSSLSYLKSLRVNTLKIDQSFVRDMLVDKENLNILEAIIGLASIYKRNVIAEGVESVEQGKKLLELKCEHAQGYAIERPMLGEDLLSWYENWTSYDEWLSY